MHLPIEIWMQILESVTHDQHLARPVYVDCFIDAFLKSSGTEKEEEELVRCLPEFERRAWKTTRSYYAIDSRTRQAAQQVFLSGVLLQTCSAPLHEVPKRRTKGKLVPRGRLTPPSADDGESAKSFYAPNMLRRMRPREGEDGEPQPTYLALEIFEADSIKEAGKCLPRGLSSLLLVEHSCLLLEDMFREHRRGLMGDGDSVLGTVRTVELLATSPDDDSLAVRSRARELAQSLRKIVELVWVDLMVEGGVVRVME